MATINIRVDDELREALSDRARASGTNLSDYLRIIITNAVVPSREPAGGEQTFAPASMSPRDRQMFALLHRILARVLPEDANGADGDLEYQLERASILERGFTAEYGDEFVGLSPELSKSDCLRVMDILDMFRTIDFSVREIEGRGEKVPDEAARWLRYRGFDFNNSREGHMADYVEYLLSQGKWEERREDIVASDNGNSHMEMLDTYSRMLAEYQRIVGARPPMTRWSTPLSAAELQTIANGWVHPSHRGVGETSENW